MKQDELNEILAKHKMWLNGEDGGSRADLSGSDLRYSNLSGSNLRYSNLSGSNLRYSNLSGSNLSGSNLSGSNLSGSNLRYSDLRGSTGNMAEIKSLFIETYPITYTAEYLQIGCERHEIEKWWGFNDARILEMDGKTALTFWRKWKGWLKQTIEMSPATPTRRDEE